MTNCIGMTDDDGVLRGVEGGVCVRRDCLFFFLSFSKHTPHTTHPKGQHDHPIIGGVIGGGKAFLLFLFFT